jgi:multidrug efflux pump subunit AcrB
VSVYSPDGRYDDLFLSNYVKVNLLERLASLPGVGGASLPGEREYAMRIWLNPDKLATLGLTAPDVRRAVASQNRQNPAGAVGQPPVPPGVELQYPVNAPGRLLDPSRFRDIVIRVESDGSLVRVKDVGRVELGAADYRRFARRDGTAAASIGISQMPGANAAATAGRERPELTSVSSPFRVSVPQLSVSLDRDKAEILGIPVTDVYDALQTFLGGVYVNDFNLFGRTWKVLMQAYADFRLSPDDVDRFYVRTGWADGAADRVDQHQDSQRT